MILDATERLMVNEGYAAVSTRRIAQDLGLNPATVHYYFPATEDVFIALHRRMTERQFAALETVLGSDDPLVALWEFQSGWSNTALGVEFLALANHRKAMGEILATATDASRSAAATAIDRAVGTIALGQEEITPLALGTILIAIGRLLANEERVGITSGHREVRALVSALLARASSATAGTPVPRSSTRAS